MQQAQMQGRQGEDSKDTGGAAGAVLSTAVLGIRTVAAFNLQDTAHARSGSFICYAVSGEQRGGGMEH